MGYFLDWVSVEGLTSDEVLDRLGVSDTGKRVDFPHGDGAMWAITPDGRVLVVTKQYGILNARWLERLSHAASLVAVSAETNECTASASGYEDGGQRWRLYASTEVGDGLESDGRPPPEWAEIHADLRRQLAADPDSGAEFEAVLDLAARVGGWGPESEVGADLQFFATRGRIECLDTEPRGSWQRDLGLRIRARLVKRRALMGPTLLATYFVEYLLLGAGQDFQGRGGAEGYEPLVASLFVAGFLAWAVSLGEGATLMLVLLGAIYIYRTIILYSVGLSDSSSAGLASWLAWFMIVVLAIQCAGWWMRRGVQR